MLRFLKYQGAGNDFVVLDCTHALPSFDFPHLARYLCDRRCGIGADGLLLLLPSRVADFRMRIFNADGSEPSMCGNGLRCLAKYIFSRHSTLIEISIETLHATLKCRQCNNEIAINLGVPSILHWQIRLGSTELFVVHTGVPHAVVFVDHLDEVAVDQLGKQIRFDPRFSPEGVNVNFACVTEEGRLAIRTYERGVEAETLSCGTGAAAVAFVALKIKKLAEPLCLLTRRSFGSFPISYEEHMCFWLLKNQEGTCEIEMVGPAQEVFEGMMALPPLKS